MITAESITEDQIRELRRDTFARWQRGENVGEQLQIESAALAPGGGILGPASYWSQRITQTDARGRCAEILNARAAAEPTMQHADETDETIPDSELAKKLPEYRGWKASYEYPGFIAYNHPDTRVFVCASSDFNGDGKLDIQIQTLDGDSFNDGENEEWPHAGRTALAVFERVKPYLDKYHPGTRGTL